MTPREKTIQIENGENWIVEFWRVRGYEVVKTALGISFTLHRKPEYENRGLGLDLQYLEQFAEESAKRSQYEPKKRWLEFIDKSNPKNKTKILRVRNKPMDMTLGDIQWDCGWRQYVFDDGHLKMAEGCQYEVFEKIKELREERDALSEPKVSKTWCKEDDDKDLKVVTLNNPKKGKKK
jgi:hypothetical protein